MPEIDLALLKNPETFLLVTPPKMFTTTHRVDSCVGFDHGITRKTLSFRLHTDGFLLVTPIPTNPIILIFELGFRSDSITYSKLESVGV
jgi:hypothetical protein